MMRPAGLLLLSCLLAGAQQPVRRPQGATPDKPPVPEEQLGAIAGTVVDALSGMPLRKVAVEIRGIGINLPALTAVTDERGGFSFEQVPPGNIGLQARKPSPVRPAPMKVVELAPGERKTGVQLTLAPSGAISGRVVDAEGEPIANCYMTVSRLRLINGQPTLDHVNARHTSPDGEYRIDNLDAGRYYVQSQCSVPLLAHPLRLTRDSQNYPQDIYVPDFYPGVTEWTTATAVKVAAGAEVRGIDFKARVQRAFTLSGRIALPDNPDPSETRLMAALVSRDHPTLDMGRHQTGVNPRTGQFQIRQILPGSYLLMVHSMDPNSPLYASTPVDIGKEPLPAVTLAFQPTTTIEGLVEWADNPPEDLQKVSPLRFSYGTGHPRMQPREVVVAADGKFRMEHIAASKVTLHFDNMQSLGYIQSITWGTQELTTPEITISPGMTGPLNIRLSRRAGIFTGKIKQDLPTPASILLIPTGTRPFLPSSQLIAMSMAGEQFSIARVPPGRYKAVALEGIMTAQLVNSDFDLQKVVPSLAEEVEISEGGSTTKDLPLITMAALDAALQEQ